MRASARARAAPGHVHRHAAAGTTASTRRATRSRLQLAARSTSGPRRRPADLRPARHRDHGARPTAGRRARPLKIDVALGPTPVAARHQSAAHRAAGAAATTASSSPDVAARRAGSGWLEDGHAFDVMGHREQVEGSDRGRSVASRGGVRNVAGQRRRVTSHVADGARPPGDDALHDRPAGPGARGIQHDEVGRGAGKPPWPLDRLRAIYSAGGEARLRHIRAGRARRPPGRPRPPDPATAVGAAPPRTDRPRSRGPATAPPDRARDRPASPRPGCRPRPGCTCQKPFAATEKVWPRGPLGDHRRLRTRAGR